MPAFDAVELALMRRCLDQLIAARVRAVVEPPRGDERLFVVAVLGPGGRFPAARRHTEAEAQAFAEDLNAVLTPRS